MIVGFFIFKLKGEKAMTEEKKDVTPKEETKPVIDVSKLQNSASIDDFIANTNDPEALDALIELDKGSTVVVAPEVKPKGEDEGVKPPEDKTEVPEDKTLVTIDDKYIQDQPEAERKIYESVKGERFSPKALKNYLNAQKKIMGEQEITDERPALENFEVPNELLAKRQVQPVKFEASKVDEYVKNFVNNEMRTRYPSMPSDMDERKNWLADLQANDPEGARDFFVERDRLASEIKTDIGKTLEIFENPEKYRAETLMQGINLVKSFIFGKRDPSEFGIDFSIKEGKNEIIDHVIRDGKGKFDPNIVIQPFEGVYAFHPVNFAVKTMRTILPLMLHAERVKGRKEGIEGVGNKKPNSTLSGQVQGKTDRELDTDILKKLDTDEFISEESLNKILADAEVVF
jgi:hypothetical protein